MMMIMLKSKIHRATVTAVERDYEGSICIDRKIMRAADFHPYEKVLVANLNNGERFETYAIPSPAGSGTICLNGATAHKGKIGDEVIIFTFCGLTKKEMASHKPRIVILGKGNRIVESRQP